MTMAQFGAEVIRIDPIGGGIDYNRWPVTDERRQPLLGRAQQGEALGRAGARQAGGARAGAGDRDRRPAPGARHRADQPAAAARSRLRQPESEARRCDPAAADRQSRRHAPRSITRSTRRAAFRWSPATRPGRAARRSTMCCRPGTSRPVFISRPRCSPPSATAPAPARGRRSSPRSADVMLATVGHLGYVGDVQINGTRAAGDRQRSLRQLRARFRDRRRPAGHDHRADPAAMARDRPRHRARRQAGDDRRR